MRLDFFLFFLKRVSKSPLKHPAPPFGETGVFPLAWYAGESSGLRFAPAIAGLASGGL
jgi:hypothetical protein